MIVDTLLNRRLVSLNMTNSELFTWQDDEPELHYST